MSADSRTRLALLTSALAIACTPEPAADPSPPTELDAVELDAPDVAVVDVPDAFDAPDPGVDVPRDLGKFFGPPIPLGPAVCPSPYVYSLPLDSNAQGVEALAWAIHRNFGERFRRRAPNGAVSLGPMFAQALAYDGPQALVWVTTLAGRVSPTGENNYYGYFTYFHMMESPPYPPYYEEVSPTMHDVDIVGGQVYVLREYCEQQERSSDLPVAVWERFSVDHPTGPLQLRYGKEVPGGTLKTTKGPALSCAKPWNTLSMAVLGTDRVAVLWAEKPASFTRRLDIFESGKEAEPWTLALPKNQIMRRVTRGRDGVIYVAVVDPDWRKRVGQVLGFLTDGTLVRTTPQIPGIVVDVAAAPDGDLYVGTEFGPIVRITPDDALHPLPNSEHPDGLWLGARLMVAE